MKGTTYMGVFDGAEHDGDIHFFVRFVQVPPPSWVVFEVHTPIFEVTPTKNGPKNHFFYIGGS